MVQNLLSWEDLKNAYENSERKLDFTFIDKIVCKKCSHKKLEERNVWKSGTFKELIETIKQDEEESFYGPLEDIDKFHDMFLLFDSDLHTDFFIRFRYEEREVCGNCEPECFCKW